MALGTTNISTTLVGTTLGTSSRDVGTLCTHPAINKWSKYKPVRFDSVKSLTEAELKSVNFGFSIQETTGTPTVGTLSRSWAYLRPLGGYMGSQFRLGDFRGYDHAEQVPMFIHPDYLTQLWNVFISQNPNFNSALTYKIGSNSYYGAINNRLGIDDFSVSNNPYLLLKDMYYSIGAFEGSTFHCVTAPSPLKDGTSNGGSSISSIDGTSLSNYLKNVPDDTPVTIYAFLNSVRNFNSNTNNYAVGNVAPLPNFQPITFTKRSDFYLNCVHSQGIYIDHANFNANLYRWQYPDGRVVLSGIKSAVIAQPDSSIATYRLGLRIYGKPEWGKNDIDLKNITMKCNLFNGNSIVTPDSMKIVRKYVSGAGFTDINQTIAYNSNPSVNTSYSFAGVNETDYYEVEFVKTGNISVFRNNAVNDSNLPALATYEATFNLYMFGVEIPFSNTSNYIYRFS